MKGFIVSRTNEELNGKEYIFLYGRLENQESFASKHQFSPYFFIKENDIKLLEKIDIEKKIIAEVTNLKNFNGKEVVKLIFKNQKHLIEVSKELKEFEIETFEEDIKPATRFMLDNNLFDYINLEGEFQEDKRADRFYENPKIKSCKGKTKLRILSIDIESGKSNNKFFCVGIYTSEIKEVLMITKNKLPGVISCKTERECLEKLKERIIEIDPDIIVGWNVIDFDFVYLKKLFDEHKISFDIGRNNRSPRIRVEKGFLRKSSIEIP